MLLDLKLQEHGWFDTMVEEGEIILGKRITKIEKRRGYYPYNVCGELWLEVDGKECYRIDVEQFFKVLTNSVPLTLVKKRKYTWIEILDRKGYRSIEPFRLERKEINKNRRKFMKEYEEKYGKIKAIL